MKELKIVLFSYPNAPHGMEILKALIKARINIVAVILKGYPDRDNFHFWQIPIVWLYRIKKNGLNQANYMLLLELSKSLWLSSIVSKHCALVSYINLKIEKESSRKEDVAKIAGGANIPIIRTHNHNDIDCIKTLKKLMVDVLVLAGSNILKVRTINIPAHGCINFHSSILPKFRGPAPIFWQLWYGEKAGVTIHYIDKGIDTGNIILQREVDVVPCDNVETLHERAIVVGGKLMVQALEQITNGTEQRKLQKGIKGSYYSTPTKEQEARLTQILKERWEK